MQGVKTQRQEDSQLEMFNIENLVLLGTPSLSCIGKECAQDKSIGTMGTFATIGY